MKEITYNITLNFNTDFAGTTVIETRSIKRNIVEGASKTIQLMKSKKREYAIKEVSNPIAEILVSKCSLVLTTEISSEEFKSFMDESNDIFSVELARFNL